MLKFLKLLMGMLLLFIGCKKIYIILILWLCVKRKSEWEEKESGRKKSENSTLYYFIR